MTVEQLGEVNMTYWHMQLHPNDVKFEREVNILQQTNLIGLGDWENNRGQIKQFSQEMKVGDIVLVKRGRLALALVEVVGEVNYEKAPNAVLDWFSYRRKINILSIADDKADNFPQPRGTLSKAINTKTKTYQYINDWYNKIVVHKVKDDVAKHKIRPHLFGLFIEKHKMFVDFTISFVDEKNEPLPVVVLAGINGSGKTTLLEYIDRFSTTNKSIDKDYIEVESPHKKMTKIYQSSRYNKGATGIAEIRKKMHDIFTSLNLQFSFNRLDEKDNVFFNNTAGAEFSIDALSTGEKILLSNLFNLYVGDYSEKIILIDEPEISLHPSWQHKIIKLYEKFCKEQNSQIIIATHSPQIIGSVKNDALKILCMDNGRIVLRDKFLSYGRDSNWVLSKVMGSVERNDRVTEEITRCQTLLVNEDYEACEACLDRS